MKYFNKSLLFSIVFFTLYYLIGSLSKALLISIPIPIPIQLVPLSMIGNYYISWLIIIPFFSFLIIWIINVIIKLEKIIKNSIVDTILFLIAFISSWLIISFFFNKLSISIKIYDHVFFVLIHIIFMSIGLWLKDKFEKWI